MIYMKFTYGVQDAKTEAIEEVEVPLKECKETIKFLKDKGYDLSKFGKLDATWNKNNLYCPDAETMFSRSFAHETETEIMYSRVDIAACTVNKTYCKNKE